MHLSDESAEESVNAMQELTGFVYDSKVNLLATKEDISLLKGDLSSLKIEITSLKKEFNAEYSSIRRNAYPQR